MKLTCLILFLLSGCNIPRVNIPPLKGDLAGSNPNASRVLAVETTALKYALLHWPPTGDVYAVTLPEGTSDKAYRTVIGQLPEGASTAEQYGSSLPTYKIAQVHLSGTTARIDLIRPDAEGVERLVSVFETVDITGWYVTRAKLWDIPVDQALAVIRQTP